MATDLDRISVNLLGSITTIDKII